MQSKIILKMVSTGTACFLSLKVGTISTRASQKLDRASQKEVAGTELQLRQNLAAGCECRKK